MSEIFFENHEVVHVITETIPAGEIVKKIYKGESLPQDPRFLPIEQGGVFKYFYVSELVTPAGSEGEFFSLVENGKEIVGMAELEKKQKTQNIFMLKFVSVDQNHQGHGYGSRLVEEIFKFAGSKGFVLEGSMRNADGKLKLKHLMERFADQYSVKYIAAEDRAY